MIDYRVYLVTDEPSRYPPGPAWLELVRAAAEGGVTCVQYRDTESSPRERRVRVLALRDALKPLGTPLVVNNDAALAAAVKAEGVHVGQRDLPVAEVRAIVGPACEIGLSVTDPAQVASARSARPDCLGIGPVFDARKTKPDAARALGTDGLASIVALAPDVPNCAIGGITPENAASVLAAGAGGLAVVGAFSRAADPFAVARRFRRLFDGGTPCVDSSAAPFGVRP